MGATGWLIREGEVLAAVEVAENRRDRRRGLRGRDGFEGALLLPHCRSIHTVGMRFAVDVAFLRTAAAGAEAVELIVLRTITVGRFRPMKFKLRANATLEAEVGAFGRWRLQPGDRLEVKE